MSLDAVTKILDSGDNLLVWAFVLWIIVSGKWRNIRDFFKDLFMANGNKKLLQELITLQKTTNEVLIKLSDHHKENRKLDEVYRIESLNKQLDRIEDKFNHPS